MTRMLKVSIPEIVYSLRMEKIKPRDYLTTEEKIFNKLEPDIRAFLPEDRRFERLQLEFNTLNNEFNLPDQRPPLYGLLIGVKDIFHVNGFPTIAGSKLPQNRLTGNEAESVTTLRNAGVLVLGKTITTEFAYIAPGPTRNPHNYAHTPGGSSSGSAAAVAAGLVPFAFGTQTIGSIIRPASFCGVVGFKPTYDRISKVGVIPLAPSVDTVGFFTADVSSAQYMASYLCVGWQGENPNSYPVLAVPEGPYLQYANPEMQAHLYFVIEKLANAGYRVSKVPAMSDFDALDQHHNTIVAVEAAQTHEKLFEEFGQYYHQKTIDLILRGKQTSLNDYQAALSSREKLREEMNRIMENHKIDLWLSPPAVGPAPKGLDSTGNPIMNMPWTHCGFPTINIPTRKNDAGLPLGLQVTANWFQDERLLAWSLDLESILRDQQ